MAAFLLPFDTSTVLGGLQESLYQDHSNLSSFLAVTTAAVWSHLWNCPENLTNLAGVLQTLSTSCFPFIIPFCIPILLWFGLDRFLRQSENAFQAINRLVDFEREKLNDSQYDLELKQCLELMKKNRQDYQDLLRLCDQFPGQRAKTDLDRLTKARMRTSGSGDIMQLQCLSEMSDSTDTDWPERGRHLDDGRTARRPGDQDMTCFRRDSPTLVVESDSDRTCPGFTDDDDDSLRLKEAAWRYESSMAHRSSNVPRRSTRECDCQH